MTQPSPLPKGAVVSCAHCGEALDGLRAPRVAVTVTETQTETVAKLVHFCGDACRLSASSLVARVSVEHDGPDGPNEPDRSPAAALDPQPAPLAPPVPPATEPSPAAAPSPAQPASPTPAKHRRADAAKPTAGGRSSPSRPPARQGLQFGPGEAWFVASASLCAVAAGLAWSGLLLVASYTLGAAGVLFVVWALSQRSEPLRRAPLAALTPVVAIAGTLLLWIWQPPRILLPLCACSAIALVALMRWCQSQGRARSGEPLHRTGGVVAWVGGAVALVLALFTGGSVEVAGVAGLLTLVTFGNPTLSWGRNFRGTPPTGARAQSGLFCLLNLGLPLAVLVGVAFGLVPPLALPAGVFVASGFWLAFAPRIQGAPAGVGGATQPLLDHPSAVGGRERH